MKNITLSINDGVLREVRKYAAERETTVNALVRDYLTRLAQQKSESARAREELARMSDESKGRLGPGWAWNRENLYAERTVLPRHERAVLRSDRPRARRKQKGAGG
jgi:hypothetical protein